VEQQSGKLVQAVLSFIVLRSCQDKHTHHHVSWAHSPLMYLQALQEMRFLSGEQEQQLVMVQKQVNKFRWKRKAEKRKRRLHQVFLRGDNIVTVTPVLRDVERDWSQLVYQWRVAGFPEAALVTPASLAAAAGALPPPPPLPLPFPPQRLSPTAVQMLPPWAGDRR